MLPTRRTNSLRYDRDAELRLIAEAGHWLADAGRRRPDAVRSITAMLDRQQRLAACRALERPLESS
ncbi:hypothetical protein [Actinoallomurus sp. NPDC052274]|uniref:hypothetical protein n=1 Tax=Actinoallomurus sp. NPDC052274 TaxID=3155420 RepID=UPI00342CF5B1